MKILSWNLRGCRSFEKRHYLKEILIKEHIDVVCLQETKIDTFSNRMLLSISIIFKSWYFLPTTGSSGVGGILLGLNYVIMDVLSVKMVCFSITILLRNK
jgi:exonuclease III